MPKLLPLRADRNGQHPPAGSIRIGDTWVELPSAVGANGFAGVFDDATTQAIHQQQHAEARGSSRLLAIGELFEGFHQNGSGYKALCPAHHDNNPSLSINEGDDGRILIHCFAGCDTQDIMEAVGLTMADLMPTTQQPRRIVATYDYYDEQGELLYQAVRYVPKDFRQRSPDGNGGWTWSTKGVRRVLFRLPELLARPKEPVFIVEGEKDADRLASLGGLATTNVCGAKAPWLGEYNEFLRGRHVAVLPDNDTAGWDHAWNVARSLHGVAASVRIVELPGLPDKGDVSDWLDTGGTVEQLEALAEATPPYVPYDPTGLQDANRRVSVGYVGSQPYGTPPVGSVGRSLVGPGEQPVGCGLVGSVGLPPFPIGALPRRLQAFAASIAKALPCPVDFPGVMMLPVLSAFIGRKRCVQIKESWVEHPLLWAAVVASSGDRKTPALKYVAEPLRRKQHQLKVQHLEAMRLYNLLSKEEQAAQAKPQMRQVLTTDITIESLKDVLDANPNGIVYQADELSGWVRAMSQYKGGRGDDRQHWLSIHSCVQIVCNRKSNAVPIIIDNPFVSVTGGIQPSVLGDLIHDVREDGFAARILLAYPNRMPNAEWNEETVEGEQDYADTCERLWNLPPSDPAKFSPAAKARWVDWINGHRKEAPPVHLRPTWAKAEGHCARLALVLFLSRMACEESAGTEIDEASIDGAIRLIEYFKAHARRVYNSVTDQQDQSRIGQALKWVRKQGGTVTARKVQQHGVCGVKTSDQAAGLLRDLEELGHGTVTEEARGSVVFRLAEPTDPTPYGSTVPAATDDSNTPESRATS